MKKRLKAALQRVIDYLNEADDNSQLQLSDIRLDSEGRKHWIWRIENGVLTARIGLIESFGNKYNYYDDNFNLKLENILAGV